MNCFPVEVTFSLYMNGSSEIFASNKKTDTNRSEEATIRIHLGQSRLPFPFLKPALTLMYPIHIKHIQRELCICVLVGRG